MCVVGQGSGGSRSRHYGLAQGASCCVWVTRSGMGRGNDVPWISIASHRGIEESRIEHREHHRTKAPADDSELQLQAWAWA